MAIESNEQFNLPPAAPKYQSMDHESTWVTDESARTILVTEAASATLLDHELKDYSPIIYADGMSIGHLTVNREITDSNDTAGTMEAAVANAAERVSDLDHSSVAPEITAPKVVSSSLGEAILTTDELAKNAESAMAQAITSFKVALIEYPTQEPGPDQNTTISFVPATRPARTATGYSPAGQFEYSADDPYTNLNREQVAATTSLIETVMEQAALLRPTRDPGLTYDGNPIRSRFGTKNTLLTGALASMDPTLHEWMRRLPNAECLRFVSKPAMDEPMFVATRNGIEDIPKSPVMQAIAIGTKGGRAVREREAWEEAMIEQIIAGLDLTDGELRITSLGTGTGEPGMDISIAAMEKAFPDGNFKVVVNGYDLSRSSLKVAEYIAAQKKTAGTLVFNGDNIDILSQDGIERTVGGTQPHVIEAIGFSEYVASEHPASEEEATQRRNMLAKGALSAEEFYSTIYEQMPTGSVFLTGNMRNDNTQSSFIKDGLGWGSIIQRSTTDYLEILERAGIPAEAVTFFMPDMDRSAADYNLVAIRKI